MRVPAVPFGDAIRDVSAGNIKIAQSEFLGSGRLAVVDQGKSLVAGYTDEVGAAVTTSGAVIVFGDHTRALKFVDFPFAMGADGTKVLQVREGLDPKYVYWYLASLQIPSAGYSRHFKFLKQISVPVPPISEQRRIAAILDHADALRAKRRQVLAHLDALTQSIFHDMFGDPARNPQAFPMESLGRLALKFGDGPFGSNLKSEHYSSHGVPVIRLQNIGVGKFLGTDRTFVSEAHYEGLKKHDCRPGDVLIATLGDPNLRACIQPATIPLALNKADCVQMRVDPDGATAEWACALLNMPGTLALANSLILGQTRSRISMGRLRELEIPVPPLPMQEKFAERVQALRRAQGQQEVSIETTDSLFDSLQARAFTGEL